jgi:hypothetical protein
LWDLARIDLLDYGEPRVAKRASRTDSAYTAGGKFRRDELLGFTQPTTKQGNGLAIAGLVVSIVGIFVLNIMLGPLGIIFGGIGWSRANNGANGKGMAIAAVVIGIVDILLFIGLVAAAPSNHGHFVWHI